MEEKFSKLLSKNEIAKISSFLSTGYDDYLAARILINHDLLSQGTILANTSIEKFLKAILTIKGDKFKFTHKTTVLMEELIGFDDELYSKINKEYVNLIEKSYQLRYIDSVPPRFRITLVRRTVLAELDYIISLLTDRILFETSISTNSNKTKYNYHKKIKNCDLYLNNFILNSIAKSDFIQGIDNVYEFINREKGGFIEVFYTAEIKS